MVEGNKLYIYDSNFNLIQTNTYPTITNIKDLLYLEQGSNFVIIGDDVIIKSSFTGRVLDERRVADIDGDQSANAILSGYKSRYIYDYNQVIFNMDGPKSNYLNLNSLQVTTSATSATQLDLGNTVLKLKIVLKVYLVTVQLN